MKRLLLMFIDTFRYIKCVTMKLKGHCFWDRICLAYGDSGCFLREPLPLKANGQEFQLRHTKIHMQPNCKVLTTTDVFIVNYTHVLNTAKEIYSRSGEPFPTNEVSWLGTRTGNVKNDFSFSG